VKRVVLEDAEAVAHEGARQVAAEARARLAASDTFHLALSGGRTPWRMLGLLATDALPWSQVHLWQVDERLVPADHPERNWRQVRASLVDRVPIPEANLHPIPVELGDADAVAAAYARELARALGPAPPLDLVHLGLGDDGHTASLVPGDAILEVEDRDAAATSGPYQGHRRVSLTLPLLRRARQRLWLVTGSSKKSALDRLEQSDPTIPAGRLGSYPAVLVVDAAATGGDRR